MKKSKKTKHRRDALQEKIFQFLYVPTEAELEKMLAILIITSHLAKECQTIPINPEDLPRA